MRFLLPLVHLTKASTPFVMLAPWQERPLAGPFNGGAGHLQFVHGGNRQCLLVLLRAASSCPAPASSPTLFSQESQASGRSRHTMPTLCHTLYHAITSTCDVGHLHRMWAKRVDAVVTTEKQWARLSQRDISRARSRETRVTVWVHVHIRNTNRNTDRSGICDTAH